MDILSEAAQQSTQLWIASAFIDGGAIDLLASWLKRPKHLRPDIILVTGLFQRFNRKRHLIRLQSMAASNTNNLRILIAPGNFHWKYYAWKEISNRFHILASSANFTMNGMQSSGEWTVRLDKTIKDPSQDPLTGSFLKLISQSENIIEKNFDDYQECDLTHDHHADRAA